MVWEMYITHKKDNRCAVAMTIFLLPVSFCQRPNIPICNPYNWVEKKWSFSERAWCLYFFSVPTRSLGMDNPWLRQKPGISVIIDGDLRQNCDVSRVFIMLSVVLVFLIWAVLLCCDYHIPGHSAIQINLQPVYFVIIPRLFLMNYGEKCCNPP